MIQNSGRAPHLHNNGKGGERQEAKVGEERSYVWVQQIYVYEGIFTRSNSRLKLPASSIIIPQLPIKIPKCHSINIENMLKSATFMWKAHKRAKNISTHVMLLFIHI